MATNSEGDSGCGTRRGGHCGSPEPVRALAASDIDTDAARAGYLDYVYACTHRDADANASTAYYLADLHVHRHQRDLTDGASAHDGDADHANGNDGSDRDDSDTAAPDPRTSTAAAS
jgi:hypothetical protein